MTKYMGVLLALPLGELSPQVTERAHAVRLVAKVLGAMRTCPAALLPLPLGEVASPQAMTERAHAICPVTKASGAIRSFPAVPKGIPLGGAGECSEAEGGKKTPPQAYAYGGVITLLCSLHP